MNPTPPITDRDLLRPETLPTRYEQHFDRAVLTIIAAVETGSVAMIIGILIATKQPWSLLLPVLGVVLLPIVVLGLSRLIITLEHDRVRWRFTPFWSRSLRYAEIERVETVTFQPLRDFGGWGPKWTPKAMAYIAGGTTGVRIDRTGDRKSIILSCKDADALAAAILDRAIADAETPEAEPGQAGTI